MGQSAKPEAAGDALRVLIAEDEPVPRKRLARLLSEEPGVHVVAQCAGGEDAVRRIVEEHPDVAFLDVQMPDLDGFGVIETVGAAHMPLVVFVTAYDAHAVRAFDLHAADYVLKPYEPERLHTSLERARERLRARELAGPGAPNEVERAERQLRDLLRTLGVAGAEPSAAHDQLAVRADGALRVLRTSDVDWFETEGNYVRVHAGKDSWLLRQTAANLEAQLDARQFARIHRRYIVNLRRVLEIQPWFGGDAIVVLRDGSRLRLSRSFRERFHARFLGDAEEPPRHRLRHAAADED